MIRMRGHALVKIRHRQRLNHGQHAIEVKPQSHRPFTRRPGGPHLARRDQGFNDCELAVRGELLHES
jgi:hypothetical protein